MQESGGRDTAIPSGPLHDAAEMARLIPTVMIFSSSPEAGVAHEGGGHAGADLRVAIEAYGRPSTPALGRAAAGELTPYG